MLPAFSAVGSPGPPMNAYTPSVTFTGSIAAASVANWRARSRKVTDSSWRIGRRNVRERHARAGGIQKVLESHGFALRGTTVQDSVRVSSRVGRVYLSAQPCGFACRCAFAASCAMRRETRTADEWQEASSQGSRRRQAGCSRSAASLAAEGFAVHEIAPGNYVHYGVHEERSPSNLGDQANIGFIVGDQCVAVDRHRRLAAGGQGAARGDPARDRAAGVLCDPHARASRPPARCRRVSRRSTAVRRARAAAACAGRARQVLPEDPAARPRRSGAGQRAGRRPRCWSRARWCSTSATARCGCMRGRWRTPTTTSPSTTKRPGRCGCPICCSSITRPWWTAASSASSRCSNSCARCRPEHFVPGHGRTDLPWPAALDPQVRYLEVIVRETRAGAEEQEDHPGSGGHGRRDAGEELGQLRAVPSPQRDRRLHRAGMGVGQRAVERAGV